MNEQEIVILIAETVRGKDPAPAKLFLIILNFQNNEKYYFKFERLQDW